MLRCPTNVELPGDDAFLQPGSKQIAAGYCIYGPSTQLVLTVGHGTHAFTLDREKGEFVLTTENMQIPAATHSPSTCPTSVTGKRRCRPTSVICWPARKARASTCAGSPAWWPTHRILTRGGIFIYPWDKKDPSKAGKLRLMYEANPMGLLVEQAGGAAWTGRERILDIQPDQLHQRVPVFLGSREEVAEAVRPPRARRREGLTARRLTAVMAVR